MKQLVFDVTDAGTIADSDSVGAFVRAGTDGDLIGSQNVNSQDWLNVASILYDDAGAAINDANPLPVDLVSPLEVNTQIDGDYDVSTNSDPDSAGMILHDRGASPDATSQNQRPTAANPDADDLDPANIHAMDVNAFGMAWDGTAWDRLTASNTDGALDVHIAGSEDLNVNDAALADTAIANAATTLTTAGTAQSVVGSALADRKYLWIHNEDNRRIFLGGSGVTESNGFPLTQKAAIMLRAGASVDVQFVGPSGQTPEIRVLELS